MPYGPLLRRAMTCAKNQDVLYLASTLLPTRNGVVAVVVEAVSAVVAVAVGAVVVAAVGAVVIAAVGAVVIAAGGGGGWSGGGSGGVAFIIRTVLVTRRQVRSAPALALITFLLAPAFPLWLLWVKLTSVGTSLGVALILNWDDVQELAAVLDITSQGIVAVEYSFTHNMFNIT